jgi:1-acyl-sn-glycerol-3-phosphate acyltransferase
MLFLRSLAFWLLFPLESAFFVALAVPTFAMPRGAMMRVARMWSRASLFFLRALCGIRCEVEGRENLPRGRYVIFASKHQSAWETIAYQALIGPVVFMFKREILIFLFPFGLAMLKCGNIMVERGATTKAGLARLVAKFRRALARTNVVVFPEGTRTRPGAPPAYKSGLAVIAARLGDAAIVPVAMDAGRYWPKRGFIKRPGTIKVHLLPPIETAGMSRDEIHSRVEKAIESAMAEL